MILTKEEKNRIVSTLSWMITDMKHKSDELKGAGNYSSELTEAINLFNDIVATDTVENTGCHRKAVSVNCREFKCRMNKQGICALGRITLQSSGSLVLGQLKCINAEEGEEEDERTV